MFEILLALNVSMSFSLPLSTSLNPVKTVIIVVTTDINSVITIMAPIPFPTQNIIIGANATLGKAFNTTK